MKGLESAFTQLFEDTLNQQGWTVPTTLQKTMIGILVHNVDKTSWQPETSYAELYLKARTPSALRSLGDTCWFTRAIFPHMGLRRGINSSYYTGLGQGCYSRLLTLTGPHRTLELMIIHFDFLAEIAWTVVHAQGQFRAMWDD